MPRLSAKEGEPPRVGLDLQLVTIVRARRPAVAGALENRRSDRVRAASLHVVNARKDRDSMLMSWMPAPCAVHHCPGYQRPRADNRSNCPA